MVTGGVEQRAVGVRCRIAFPRAAQRLERTLQSQALGRLLLPRCRPEGRPTTHRPPQRRQVARRLDAVDALPPIQRHRQGPAIQQVQAPPLGPPCQTRQDSRVPIRFVPMALRHIRTVGGVRSCQDVPAVAAWHDLAQECRKAVAEWRCGGVTFWQSDPHKHSHTLRAIPQPSSKRPAQRRNR